MIPIYRAKKKVGDDESVEGNLIVDKSIKDDIGYYLQTSNNLHSVMNHLGEIGFDEDDFTEINPSTLTISVDKKNWFSVENLNHILTSNEVTGIQE